VKALQLQDDMLYVGGFFGSVNGVTRNYLAALDPTTGAAAPDWDPNPDGFIWSLTTSPKMLYAGGGYERMNALPVGSIAALRTIPGPLPPPRYELLTVAPNPTVSGTTLRFSLAESARASLAVFDVQGRRMATLLDAAPLVAGDHAVAVPTSDWPVGCYLARLDVNGGFATRKLVVLGQGR
jgi:hypothetical protein